MAQSLKIIGNYLVITNTVTGTTIEYPTNNVRYKDDSTNIRFSYINDDSQSVSFLFSELVDENNVAFTSINVLLYWLRSNTGNAGQLNNVDLTNSTNIPLGISGTFTGQWIDSSIYGTATISIISDQDSAIDGLIVDYSDDGITVIQNDVFNIYANKGKVFSFGMANRYMRVRYINGLIAQTSFNIQTIFKNSPIKNSSHRVKDAIVGEDDAELIKAVITGRRDDAIYDNARLDDDNNLLVNSLPYTYSIAEGYVSGHDPLLKFGTRTTLLANVTSTVWEGNTALYVYMSTAQQLKVVSSSAQDGVGGTGALTVILYGLDASFNEINETITMNGLTVVTTIQSFLRIYRVNVVTSGTSYTNVGKITVYNNAQTTEQAIVNIGDGSTLMTMWTVPAGKQAFMLNGELSTDSNKGLTVSFFTRLNDGLLFPWQLKYRAFLFGGKNDFPFIIPFKIPAKTDIEVRVNTPASAGTTSAGSTFQLWYENETV